MLSFSIDGGPDDAFPRRVASTASRPLYFRFPFRTPALPSLLSAVAASFAVAACAYDFDHFAAQAAAGNGGSSNTSGGSSASGGSEASGGTLAQSGGDAGAAGDAGQSSSTGGAASDGGSAGAGGTSAGNTSNGGTGATSSGGSSLPSGGSTSLGGSSSSGGGTGGSAGFDCSALGGTVANQHCYFVVGREGMLSWSAAKTACEAQGAHLATLTSAAEQQLIAEQFFPSSSDYWIGLSLANTNADPPKSCKNNPSSCPFRWITSEAFDFTAWSTHNAPDVEPNFSGACVRLLAVDSNWADNGCSQAYLAICEHE